MKKQLSIIALLLAATGCINKVPIDFGEVTPQLVLNAQLMAEEDEQAIYLSESTLATIKPLQGAEVTVLVDGKPMLRPWRPMKWSRTTVMRRPTASRAVSLPAAR